MTETHHAIGDLPFKSGQVRTEHRHVELRGIELRERPRVALHSLGRRPRHKSTPLIYAASQLFSLVYQTLRLLDQRTVSDFGARILRAVGPRLHEHHIARDNLRAAFPEKSGDQIEEILEGTWDNLGRVGAEFTYLDRLCGGEGEAWPYVEYAPESEERFRRLRSSKRGSLVFAAHLGNWELPAVIAAKNGIDAMVLYRRPNIQVVADAVAKIRGQTMGTMVATDFDAPVRLARALEAGRHVGILVDQHCFGGAPVMFFGRRCFANPLIAKLAKETGAPIYGTRVVRLGPYHFRAELSEEITPVRDWNGMVDVNKTMQTITSVIECWIREHPAQWLWAHRRWR
jgi:Kdo2-lipid IVA lauroyltransferase/acyltransferase